MVVLPLGLKYSIASPELLRLDMSSQALSPLPKVISLPSWSKKVKPRVKSTLSSLLPAAAEYQKVMLGLFDRKTLAVPSLAVVEFKV